VRKPTLRQGFDTGALIEMHTQELALYEYRSNTSVGIGFVLLLLLHLARPTKASLWTEPDAG